MIVGSQKRIRGMYLSIFTYLVCVWGYLCFVNFMNTEKFEYICMFKDIDLKT